jgi:redox-sensitive bicupin YhaK (pirin superfamily)
VTTRVLAGSAYGLESPVRPASTTLFLDHRLEPRGRVDLPAREAGIEQALYVADGEVDVVFDDDGHAERLVTGEMLVLPEGRGARLCSGADPARVALIGGAPLGRRLLWWNFVATRREQIDAAAQAWSDDTLGQVPGETERIPLPERKPV